MWLNVKCCANKVSYIKGSKTGILIGAELLEKTSWRRYRMKRTLMVPEVE